jgi:biopolymer transport protein ExbD
MRRRSTVNPGQPVFEAVNVTPLIDVVMVMIIFFLIVGKLATDADARLRLPQSGIGTTTQQPGRTITVTPAPDSGLSAGSVGAFAGIEVRVEQQIVRTIAELDGALKAGRADAPVTLRAHRDLPFDAVAPVLAACSRAGIVGVRLATERAP